MIALLLRMWRVVDRDRASVLETRRALDALGRVSAK